MGGVCPGGNPCKLLHAYGWNSLLASQKILSLGSALPLITEWRAMDFTHLRPYKIEATLMRTQSAPTKLLDHVDGRQKVYADDIATIHLRNADAAQTWTRWWNPGRDPGRITSRINFYRHCIRRRVAQ